MADFKDEMCDSEEDLIQRHKKERKALQAELQKLKHGVAKGDKKKKKEVTEKIAKLEAELDAKQEQELIQLKENHKVEEVGAMTEVTATMQNVTVADDQSTQQAKKPSKAQKRREKKAAEMQERSDRIQEQDILNLTSSRHLEAVEIRKALTRRGLQIHEIPSDGNCLYAAVSHQLELREVKTSVDTLRQQVAGYLRAHADNFMPFLTKDNGDCYLPEDFETYCQQTESTAAWGGQLEIQALCQVLKAPIEVVQAEGADVVTGQEYDGKPLVLTYYRHAYGLGEHYHSVEEKKPDPEEEFT